MHRIALSIWILVSSLIYTLKAISACDDIDVVFIIDEDTIKYDIDNAAIFIDAIIEHGSSEYSAFSVQIYGHNIQYAQDIDMLKVNLLDTYGKHRTHKSEHLTNHLMDVFNNMTLPTSASTTASISLEQAFLAAAKQEQPLRDHKKRERFNTEKYNKHKIGGEDDHNRYFIFDHFNKLFDSNNKNNICTLFEYIDGREDESIHFIMGQKFEYVGQTFQDLCGEQQHMLNENSFFYLDSFVTDKDDDGYDAYEYYYSGEDDSEEDEFYNINKKYDNIVYDMNQIYQLTCPTYMEHPQYDGHLRLSVHTQWIDPSTINECKLTYDTRHMREENQFIDELDSQKSYIIVDDHFHDDNTFKINDFLMAEPAVYDKIKQIGCLEPVYQIVRIKHIKKVNRKHKILKLYVRLPQSITDYMWESDLELANVEKHPHAREEIITKKNPHTRTKSQTTPAPFVIHHPRRMMEPPTKKVTWDDEEQLLHRQHTRKKTFTEHVAKFGSHIGSKSRDLIRSLSRKISRRDTVETERMMSEFLALDDATSSESLHVHEEIGMVVEDILLEAGDTAIKNMKKDATTIDGFGKEPVVQLDGAEKKEVKEAGEKDNRAGVLGYQKSVLDKTFSFPEGGKKKVEFKAGLDKVAVVPDHVFVTALGDGFVEYLIELTAKAEFQGRFRWFELFKPGGKANIRFQLVGTVTAKAEFKLEAELKLGITFKIDVSFGTFLIMAGPVPIIIKPYITLEAGMATTDVKFTVDLAVNYEEKIIVGYSFMGSSKMGAESKVIWGFDRRKRGWHMITRTKYMSLPDESAETIDAMAELAHPSEKEAQDGLFCERTFIKHEVTKNEISLCGKNACANGLVQFGFENIYIQPMVGVTLYAALSFEAGLKVNLPVFLKIQVDDGKSVCGNDKTKACPIKASPPLKGGPVVNLEFFVNAVGKVKLPAFIWGIREFFVVGKLARAIVKDAKELAADIAAFKVEMEAAGEAIEAIYAKLKSAVENMKKGKRTDAITDIKDVVTKVKNFEDTYKQTSTYIKKWRGKVEGHKATIAGVQKRLQSIIDNPVKMVGKQAGPWSKKLGELKLVKPKKENCVTVWKPVSDLIKNKCCEKSIRVARVGHFDDWYHGYDEYDSYNDYNDYSSRRSNSAPIVPHKNNNPVWLMLLDIFTIFIVMICMVSCACLFCGAFAFYNYNKFLQETRPKDYNRISVTEAEEPINI